MTEQEYYIKLGQDIKTLRETKGIKQAELAEKMGVRATMLSEFENKGTKISAYRINQIMEILSGETFPEKKNEIDIEITGLDAGTVASVKDNRKLREKILQSIQLLFSVDLYRDILDENEQQEEELAHVVTAKIDEVTDVLRQNAPGQAHCES